MFVQMIQGTVTDPAAMEARFDEWGAKLRPEAVGFLGATAGVTADGQFVAVARFESEDAAQANADRPEQGEWWEETVKLFIGPVTFRNTSDVDLFQGGGSDDAGFVQVMEARISDRARLQELERDSAEIFAGHRPDLIGGLRLWFDEGEFAAVDYFTSEAEAREGEARDMPPDVRAAFDEWMRLADDRRWYDLTDPWLQSP